MLYWSVNTFPLSGWCCIDLSINIYLSDLSFNIYLSGWCCIDLYINIYFGWLVLYWSVYQYFLWLVAVVLICLSIYFLWLVGVVLICLSICIDLSTNIYLSVFILFDIFISSSVCKSRKRILLSFFYPQVMGRGNFFGPKSKFYYIGIRRLILKNGCSLTTFFFGIFFSSRHSLIPESVKPKISADIVSVGIK